MPIATPEIYAQMLDTAKQRGYAFPAINVTSSQTLNAALRGFADAGSDGIVQISTGGAEYLSGAVKNMVVGASALAEFAHVVADRYPIHIALHTDHCPKDKLDGYMRPLVAISRERVQRGQEPLFQSHMWDGSAVPLKENLAIAADLLEQCAAARIIMEMEIGVVGGEEDGVVGEINEKLYTTPEDALATAEALGLGERGRYILAATFGNVHGVYKPGHVKLRPAVLKEIQDAVGQKYGLEKPFDLVFHGGSGSALEEIREAISYGVVKMNVDTDTQYAFTRPIAGHMFANYDGVLKVDGDVGNKKVYDPRSWGKAGEAGMAAAGHPRLRGPAVRRAPAAADGPGEPARRVCGPARHLPAGERGGRGRAAGGPGARRGRGPLPGLLGGLGGAGRARVRPAATRSPPTRTRGPATTAAWTSCAGRAGTATARSRGSTSRTAGFLRSLHVLGRAAGAIGEDDEAAALRAVPARAAPPPPPSSRRGAGHESHADRVDARRGAMPPGTTRSRG